jgi:hypothetical protein
LGASGALLLAPFLQTNMSKPITVILHDRKIIGAFESYDDAVKKFKSIELESGEISLHVLNRPDRKKKTVKVVTAKQPAPAKAPKQNVLNRLVV